MHLRTPDGFDIGKDQDLLNPGRKRGGDGGGCAKDIQNDDNPAFEVSGLQLRWEENDIGPHGRSLTSQALPRKHTERPRLSHPAAPTQK